MATQTADVPLELVLVIGGCGFLGGRIVTKLLESGNASEVSVLDIRKPANPINGVKYFTGNLASPDDVGSLLDQAKPEVIFHTAPPDPFGNNKAVFEEVNIGGVRNIIDCVQKRSFVKAFVYTSSSSVIHDRFEGLQFGTEDRPLIF